MKAKCFIPFRTLISDAQIPNQLNDPFGLQIPSICKIAASELQVYLKQNQKDWQYNFGLTKGKKSPAKGKMFGVLVVQNRNDQVGYLCGFSGKLGNDQKPEIFVPSLFDISTDNYAFTKGMTELTEIGTEIKKLNEADLGSQKEIEQLKHERRSKSILLQEDLFSKYHFLNNLKERRDLQTIFEDYSERRPPSGSGDCAAPKLFQYAYQHDLKPLAIAEFWWGKTTKSEDRKHRSFYPACNDKCRPILNYMLGETP